MGVKGKISDETVRLINEGNQRAFCQLYEEISQQLYFYTYRIIRDTSEANIIVADNFLKLWRLHQNFKNLNDAVSFLYVSCRNSAYDFLRYKSAAKRQHEVPLSNVQDFVTEYSDGDSVLNGMIEAQLLHDLFEVVNSLPSQRRAVVKALFLEGLTMKQVSEQLNMPYRTVVSTKEAALKQLKNLVLQKKLLPFIIFVLKILTAIECTLIINRLVFND